MEKLFPNPPPDRRIKRKKVSPAIAEMMKRQIRELREKLMNFRVVQSRHSDKLDYSVLPNHVNLLVFGPSGSGKSSLIRSFYRALYNSTELPREILDKLVVKSSLQNEGTTRFTTLELKPSQTGRFDPIGKIQLPGSSGIFINDTRGQIWLDEKEQKQLELLIEGKVKDMSLVEQRNHRYAYLLWEFWKSDSQLFPEQILLKGKKNLSQVPHCLIFVFDGSQEEVPGAEEAAFYKEIISIARQRGYMFPQVVLTRVDLVEQQVNKKGIVDQFELEQRLREQLDIKIESIVLKLGISRSCVHFVENYHETVDAQDFDIDFHSLRLLHEAVQQSDFYMLSNLKEKSGCFIF